MAPLGHRGGPRSLADVIAVIPLRNSALPAGAGDAVAESGGRAIYVEWVGVHALVESLAPLVADEDVVVLPASPDGRDLAPRLAHRLRRPLIAGAIRIGADGAEVVRHGGRSQLFIRAGGPFVATLQPGVVGASEPERVVARATIAPSPLDVETIEVRPPDAATVDLIEAPRILGGGAGLDDAERFAQLGRVAAAMGASVGATRVVTDRGWMPHDRQIGTTGVAVDPSLYIAFGISGAVQHTGGLGSPDHVISVNTDAYCPMMQLAELALVADANLVLDELERRLTP